MKTRFAGALIVCMLLGNSGWLEAEQAAPRKTMRAFASEQEFDALLMRWQVDARKRLQETSSADAMKASSAPVAPSPPAAVALMTPGTAANELDSVSVSGTAAEPDASITNVQTAGVDEGGIVKRHGEHLVVLRRGRLFTVKVGEDALKPVAMIDAYAPGADPSGAWYDEMLIARNVIAVIGYSYERGGTEIGLFDIDAAGALKYRATYHLRSNDYYSSRNYASRLIGDKLIFYTPMHLDASSVTAASFPGLRRWHARAVSSEFKRILPATRIYRSDDELDPDNGIALHTVTTCDLAAAQMQCASTAVLGPEGRVFYVSADSVFVWTTEYSDDDARPARSSVFRIPLDGNAPSALKTTGGPIDQLSFLHDAQGYLNVLLSADSDGEGMWKAESRQGDMALLRVHLRDFGDGSNAAKASDYRALPKTTGDEIQNRYVGDWLIYGSAPYRWNTGANADRSSSPAYALRYADTSSVQTLRLGHGVERIEAMGANAVLAGNFGADLHFTSLELRQRARPATVFVQRDAAQGESRTHGFFYRQDAVDQGATDLGIVGLPIVGRKRGNDMGRYLDESASVLYLRNRDLRLSRMGALDASDKVSADDGCKASCVDWYGNARPIFIGQRVFALLGYELVEGQVADEHIRERRRTSFAPSGAAKISR